MLLLKVQNIASNCKTFVHNKLSNRIMNEGGGVKQGDLMWGAKII